MSTNSPPTEPPRAGQWSAHCQSLASQRGYSQYYTFTLEEDAQVTIELTSGTDPYLFLRAGDARSGDFLRENDDIEAGANLNSRLTAPLRAGAYTIEATTYDPRKTGDFTLTISGLGGAGDTGTTPDGCGRTITAADSPVTGEWTADCQSQERSGHYARYYTFTLAQQSQVTIDLVSTVDPYLYLRDGTARTGVPEAYNDDVAPGTNTNSQISQTLDPGTWTIEATTYAADQTGAFTLTISGLSGTTTTDPDPETDTCGETITAADSPVTGNWTADCRSQVPNRGYARYYTFTLAQQSHVTIDLVSDVDPFLYLRERRRPFRHRPPRERRPAARNQPQLPGQRNPGRRDLDHRGRHLRCRRNRNLHPHHHRPGRRHIHRPANRPLRPHAHRPPTAKPSARGPPTATPRSAAAATPATTPSPWTSSRTSPST